MYPYWSFTANAPQKCRNAAWKANFQITSWEEWERWKERFEEFEDHGCVIDTSNPMDESLARVMRSIHDLDRQHIHSSID